MEDGCLLARSHGLLSLSFLYYPGPPAQGRHCPQRTRLFLIGHEWRKHPIDLPTVSHLRSSLFPNDSRLCQVDISLSRVGKTGLIWFILLGHTPSLKGVRAGPQAGTMEEHYRLSLSGSCSAFCTSSHPKSPHCPLRNALSTVSWASYINPWPRHPLLHRQGHRSIL